MRVVFDSVGGMSDLPLTFDISIAFPILQEGRPPNLKLFGAQYTAWLCLCERFTVQVARHDASLEVEGTG